ncbi:MAG: sigma-54-dependent Fis family transcriptional regulator [Gammaproteobacteria bacterium]|nr:MAG: sigma-54-dependent Fis family transcriptional regulator [Gammaproteobacteria bacterium]
MSNRPTALIIDDERDIRELIEMAFMGIGVDCILSPTIQHAIQQLKKHPFSFVVSDVRLPDGDGLDLVSHIHKKYPELPVCIITAHGNMNMAVKALKLGAFDFLNKPFDLKQLRNMAQAALELTDTQQPSTATILKTKTVQQASNKEIDGKSEVIKKLRQVIVKVARSQAPIFIYGESGTGKERVARSIHAQSARHNGPFIPINCGAIPENLMESEFFGYRKGAFTGANRDTDGFFSAADNGTIFLDEIAELPLTMQVKLLRTIQERTIRPVGSNHEIPINIRILSATHQNLEQLVKENRFREDLYYRLNVISIGIPALRKRLEDIDILTQSILGKLAQRQGVERFTLSEKAMMKLKSYDYPGNIRELENILERATTFCIDCHLTDENIYFHTPMTKTAADEADSKARVSFDLTEPSDSMVPMANSEKASEGNLLTDTNNLANYMDRVEKSAIESALIAHQLDKEKVAQHLGLSLDELMEKIRHHNIPI